VPTPKAKLTPVAALIAVILALSAATYAIAETVGSTESTTNPRVTSRALDLDPLVPATGAWLGIYAKPRHGRTQQGELRRVEAQIGRPFDIVRDYIHFDSTFPRNDHWEALESDHILLIAIKPELNDRPVLWKKIARGTYDSYIRAKAKACRSLGAPMLVVFHHEPENDLAAYGTPAEYAAAWRHFVSVFRHYGANNVEFVWNMQAWTFNDPAAIPPPSAFYPGDDVVDWIAADGYNWYPEKAWRSFGTVFAGFRRWGATEHPNKPEMVAETGVQEDPAVPSRKAAWFRDAMTTTRQWRSLKAFVYFNTDKDGNWWFDSSGLSLAGFTTLAHDSHFTHRRTRAIGVTIAGAFQTGSKRAADRGERCRYRHDGTLIYRSDALRLRRGTAVARVRFFIRHYRGRGRYSATNPAPHGRTAVQVVTARDARTRVASRFYVAIRGIVTVLQASDVGRAGRTASLAGAVHVKLRELGGSTHLRLDGTWHCRIAAKANGR
jgi:hypothetical protein